MIRSQSRVQAAIFLKRAHFPTRHHFNLKLHIALHGKPENRTFSQLRGFVSQHSEYFFHGKPC